MGALYETLALSDQNDIKFSLSIFRKAVEHLHRKEHFDEDMLADKPISDLIFETNRVLLGAVKQGIEFEIPAALRQSLENDVFVFSGCKTYVQLKEVSALLWDKDRNQVKSFDRFFKDIKTINNTYNKQYLQSEYYFAVRASQSTANWVKIEADGDDYDLQYRTAGDDKVRDEHALLNRITLPPSDPFWERYYPPNGWRCRCRAVQVLKGKYKRSNSAESVASGDDATKGKNEIFRFNPGKQKVIFPPHHPYRKVQDRIGDILSSIKKNAESLSEKLRNQRKEIRTWAKDNLIGKTAENRQIVKPIRFTVTGIKEALNQPHKFIIEKNEAIKDIGSLIEDGTYLKDRVVADKKGGFLYHYIKIQINNEPSYIVLKESTNGDMNFYSITDKIKE